ncbi:3-phosphoshikimate 1-carboxyvinyltransferase [Endomicrobium proavitum]|uniref:3-phosphoshikimate 1-carboxyvinyltransferase n=1 Tax=Endomicrobium proavitum TaxID=1408281 RepID=A0A0G3WK21_9BACT|nr:3-phosphoshikimate 1-carboxyvinyltransferase [Endomicrobium proavitum]AKL98653.1 3-phosphoshikimate 1-carboxyvinyltransferase [Endomicrobium proavitum]
MEIKLNKACKIEGTVEIPADKSITHRAVMLSSLASGGSVIKNYLPSDDCLRTIAAFEQMGAKIKTEGSALYIDGAGLKLQKPQKEIYAGNSGTTTRLLCGILAGQNFESVITGDESLSKRPMQRVIEPLSQMGAKINSNSGKLPLVIKGASPLKAIKYTSDKSSAQVKSAVLFAGLYANAATTYSEPVKSRDHSERMFQAYGAKVEVAANSVTVYPAEKLNAQNITVPGDISSAAFFIAAALIVPNSKLTITNVGINPTRDGILEVLKKMGADISIENIRDVSGEPVADIIVRYSKLKAVNIGADIIPRMVDEVPVFALIAAHAEGITKITGAKELRVKESDRISAIKGQLSKMGAHIEELEDGFIIEGNGAELSGATVNSFYDHRIAMTLAVASLVANGETVIKDCECVDISFPSFFEVLKKICR